MSDTITIWQQFAFCGRLLKEPLDWRAGKWGVSPCGGADSKTCPNSSHAFISTFTTEK
jgi:hypothetical protein